LRPGGCSDGGGDGWEKKFKDGVEQSLRVGIGYIPVVLGMN